MSVRPVFRCLFRGLAFLVASCWALAASTPTVTTVAGGFIGDGLPATSASLAAPVGVVRDSSGNLYVSDSLNCRVRRVSASGIITTIAGTGICGYSGDGGPARSAMINSVSGISLNERDGSLLLADSGNSRIRKITASGIITTVAGDGSPGFSGDGGPATQAALYDPLGVFVASSGSIYIADTRNHVVRMVDTAGIIHTVAGNGLAGFSGDGGPATAASLFYPWSVVADANGDFFISDVNNNRVRAVDTKGKIHTFAGNGSFGNTGSGGLATSASIGQPQGLLLAPGLLYMTSGGVVWTVNLATNIINLIAGTQNLGFNGDGNIALSTSFEPQGIALDGKGGLYLADTGNDRVRYIAPDQVVSTVAGGATGDGGQATSASLNISDYYSHMAFDAVGNLYIAESSSCRVRKVGPTGTISTLAGTGICGYSGDGGPAGSANLNFPEAVAADQNGNVFIADSGNYVIRKVDSAGTITTFVQMSAVALASDSSGNLYVCDGSTVQRLNSAAQATVVAGVPCCSGYNGDGIPATEAWLYGPNGLALDSAGNIYIADMFNSRIRKVDTSGIISTVAGTGVPGFAGDGGRATSAMLYWPIDISVDNSGNLYIADWVNLRIRRVGVSGIIRTIAGNGQINYNGNGLPALQTNMFPNAITVSSSGVPYFMDQSSYRVRRIH